MCNLYNIRTNQEALRQLARAFRDMTGNLPESYDIYPDYPAPIVRTGDDGQREIVRARWGMPSPPQYLKGIVDRGVTNIRDTRSPHWRAWLAPRHRCLVPATSFAEPSPTRSEKTGKVPNVWFAVDESEPLFFFAGVWTGWHGVRKKAEGAVWHQLFGFLTTRPNAVIAPIHPKAMPVILRTSEEIETWLTTPAEEALKLQRPLPDDVLEIIATREFDEPSPGAEVGYKLEPA